MSTERKLVTVLFCDLAGSTALGERLDAEAFQSVQAAYFDRMRAVVEGYEGSLEMKCSHCRKRLGFFPPPTACPHCGRHIYEKATDGADTD